MTLPRSSPLLSTNELPLAELCAARLDGELYTIADLYCPVDLPAFPAFKAAALLPFQYPHSFVERMSAAWLHGAVDSPPRLVQLALPSHAGTHSRFVAGATTRQVVITDRELMQIGGCRVTTPLRTLVDLLLDPALSDSIAIDTARVLAELYALTAANATSALRMRFRVPNTTVAENRIKLWRSRLSRHEVD